MIITATFTGFFAKQLVQSQDCIEPVEAASVGICRTNSYARFGPRKGVDSNDAIPEMISAINVGIVQPIEDSTNILCHGCVSGNCTFPDNGSGVFATVAIGHECDDLSLMLQVTSANGWLMKLEKNNTLPIFDSGNTATSYRHFDQSPSVGQIMY